MDHVGLESLRLFFHLNGQEVHQHRMRVSNYLPIVLNTGHISVVKEETNIVQ